MSVAEAPAPRARPFQGRLSPRALWALRSASDAFERVSGGDGYARCPEHGFDHSGATARFTLINCALHAATGEESYLRRAVQIARAITGRLGQLDSPGGAWVFFTGGRGAATVVDAGECLDALATLLAHAGERLEPLDASRVEDAIRLCCDSFLIPGVAAERSLHERLCGAAGLASAYAALGEPAWAEACGAALERSLDEMRPDGSFPCIHSAAGAARQALSDLSVREQGRCLAFARFAARQIGAEERHAAALRRAADFLRLVTRPDGVKPLALEANRWLWDSDWEAGSAPLDAYALAADGRGELRGTAGRAAARSAQALGPDGFSDATPDSHALVCRLAHTADLAWLARAHDAAELDDLPANPAAGAQTAPIVAADTGVVRLEARRACVILRGAKQPASPLAGGRIGGGGLVYVGRRADGWRNVLRHVPEPGVPEATWVTGGYAAPLSGRSMIRGLVERDALPRLRAARVHWRAGRRGYAVRMLWRFLGPPARAARQRWQSNHAVSAEVAAAPDAVTVRSLLARLDGTPFEGLRTERRYQIQGDNLLVHDRLIVETPVTSAGYRLPAAAQALEVTCDACWHLAKGFVHASPLGAGASVSIHYRL